MLFFTTVSSKRNIYYTLIDIYMFNRLIYLFCSYTIKVWACVILVLRSKCCNDEHGLLQVL